MEVLFLVTIVVSMVAAVIFTAVYFFKRGQENATTVNEAVRRPMAIQEVKGWAEAMMEVGGPIPCSGCGYNVVRGSVYKIATGVYLCEGCYEDAEKQYTEPSLNHEGLFQFEEKKDVGGQT